MQVAWSAGGATVTAGRWVVAAWAGTALVVVGRWVVVVWAEGREGTGWRLHGR